MAQQLRACATLSKDPSSVPEMCPPHQTFLTVYNSSSRGNQCLWPPQAVAHAHIKNNMILRNKRTWVLKRDGLNINPGFAICSLDNGGGEISDFSVTQFPHM